MPLGINKLTGKNMVSIYNIDLKLDDRGFNKGQAQGKLTGSEDDFVGLVCPSIFKKKVQVKKGSAHL